MSWTGQDEARLVLVESTCPIAGYHIRTAIDQASRQYEEAKQKNQKLKDRLFLWSIGIGTD